MPALPFIFGTDALFALERRALKRQRIAIHFVFHGIRLGLAKHRYGHFHYI